MSPPYTPLPAPILITVSHDQPRRAALFILSSALLFALMGGFIKHLSQQLPVEMVVFFRNLFGLVVLLPWLLQRGFGQLRTHHLRLHLARSLFGLSAMYCFFYAIAHLHLAEAVLLNYTAPLYVPLTAWWWLREPTPHRLNGALLLGFSGIALILKPGVGIFKAEAVVGVLAGLLTAGAFVSLRHMAQSEPPLRTVFYFGAIATLISGVPLVWSWQTPPAPLWLTLLLMGAVASGGQLLLTRAYSHAPAAWVGSFTYTIVPLSALVGWWGWGERPDALAMLGAILVVGAALIVLHQGLRNAPGRPSSPSPGE
ncbi:MAG TPA: DMT family transporter [Gammaproteobacteria bacterium]